MGLQTHNHGRTSRGATETTSRRMTLAHTVAGALAVLTATAVPTTTHAAITLTNIFSTVGAALGNFIPVLIGVAVVVFAYGVIVMILAGGNDAALAKGRKHMVWGILGLFVVVSIWGLVNLLQSMFGIDTTKTGCQSPLVPPGGSNDSALDRC